MPVLKESTVDNTVFFDLDGVNYQKGLWTVMYGNVRGDGSIDEDVVEIGIMSVARPIRTIQWPVKIEDWENGLGVAYSDLDTLLNDMVSLIGFTMGTGVNISQRVTDFVSLTPGTSTGDLAYVQNSQGTQWLPGTLGGTYYPAGWYVWNGSEWVSDRNAIANQLESIVSNTGWWNIGDDTFTDIAPQSISADTRTKLIINSDSVIESFGAGGTAASSIWSADSRFTPLASGDSYIFRLSMVANPSLNNRNLTVDLDIGGTQGIIFERTVRLARGANVDTGKQLVSSTGVEPVTC